MDLTPWQDIQGVQRQNTPGHSPSSRNVKPPNAENSRARCRTPERLCCVSPLLSEGLLGEGRRAIGHNVGTDEGKGLNRVYFNSPASRSRVRHTSHQVFRVLRLDAVADTSSASPSGFRLLPLKHLQGYQIGRIAYDFQHFHSDAETIQILRGDYGISFSHQLVRVNR